MEPRPSLRLLILAGSLSIAAPALNAQIVPGAQSNVTLALTISFTEDKDPVPSGPNFLISGRLVKETYGNINLITAMNDAGDLPDGTVSGWKLVMVNRKPEVDEQDSRSFYLVKTGRTPIPVPYLSLSELSGFAETYTDTVQAVVNEPIILTGKSKFSGQFGLSGYLPVEGNEFSMVGVASGSDKSGLVSIQNGIFKFLYQLVSAKLEGIVGSVEDSENPGDDEDLIQGSVSFSAEIPIDISGYPAPIE